MRQVVPKGSQIKVMGVPAILLADATVETGTNLGEWQDRLIGDGRSNLPGWPPAEPPIGGWPGVEPPSDL